MRAVVVHNHGPLRNHRVEVVPDPVPGPGEALIEARAIGVNFPDLLVIEGSYQVLPPRPFSPGKEVAGIVAAVGDDIGNVRPGDRVMAQCEYGAYAERVVAPQATCYRMPESMPFEAGAALGLAAQTAHFALVARANYRRGETVLITGASGGVGLAAVQVAKALGARVLAGVTSKEKGELAIRHGADHVIDLAARDLRDSLRVQVRSAVGDRGADIVLDTVGGDVFDAALRALAWSGRMVVVGFASGRVPEARANYLLVRNIAVIGLQWSDYRDREPERVREVQEELHALYVEGKLKAHVAATYPLERFADALSRFADRTVQGKMVLGVA